MHECVEERGAVRVRQHERLVAFERLARCIDQRRQAEVGEVTSLEARSALHEVLRLRVDTKAEPGSATATLLRPCRARSCHDPNVCPMDVHVNGYQETWYLDLGEQLRFASVWDSFQDTRRRERAIVELALATGLREGEQWCLHLADVHVDGPSPHVVVRYGSWDREAERYRTPKGRKASKRLRVVPHKLMFPTERGARREKPPRSWGDAVEAFGAVPRIGRTPWWHLLRHTFASSLVSGWWGMRWSIEDVSKVLGHTDIRTTHRAEGSARHGRARPRGVHAPGPRRCHARAGRSSKFTR